MLTEELEAREADIRLQHKLAGRTYLGRKAVLLQDRFSFPQFLELLVDKGFVHAGLDWEARPEDAFDAFDYGI